MWWLDFVVLAFAAGALVEAWLKSDGLFAETHDWIDAWGSTSSYDQDRYGKLRLGPLIRTKVAYGLQCHFCLSYHAAFWLLLFFYLPSLWLAPPWDLIVKLPIYSLAATRLSLILDWHAPADQE